MVDSALPKVVMTLLVRNEQDVIAENILFHYHQGVGGFIVMDNLSTDATVEVVRDLAHSIPIELRHQQDDTYSQSVWVTEMARAAATDHYADWVINNDADEFWMFPDFDARHYLNGFADDVCGVVLKRHNAVLIEDAIWDGFDAHPCFTELFELQSLNQLGSPLPGKCLHRASNQVTVQQGNHSVSGLPGPTVHCDRARILHFPYRRFQQYQSKIRLGGAAYARNTQLQANVGRTWREHHNIVDQPELVDFWQGLQRSQQRCIRAEARGECFREPRLRQELGRLINAWQQQQLHRSAQPLMASTSEVVRQSLSRFESAVGDLESSEPRSLPYNNLIFLAQGPLQHQRRLADWLESFKVVNPLHRFTLLRDLISLFPRNDALLNWMASALQIVHPHAARRLREHCSGRDVVVYISCRPNLKRSWESARSFRLQGYRTLIVTGGDVGYPDRFGFEFDGDVLSLPVPDDYEHLGSKVFYAYLILDLLAKPASIIKLDDDIVLHDANRFNKLLQGFHARGEQYLGRLISLKHRDQCHGWHLGKCTDPAMHLRGYQYPMPQVYASGGFGYVIGPKLLQSCALMYLSMQSFFEMNCIQLEDVFVGLAAQGAGIAAFTCEYEPFEDLGLGRYPDVSMAVLPGLMRLPDS